MLQSRRGEARGERGVLTKECSVVAGIKIVARIVGALLRVGNSGHRGNRQEGNCQGRHFETSGRESRAAIHVRTSLWVKPLFQFGTAAELHVPDWS